MIIRKGWHYKVKSEEELRAWIDRIEKPLLAKGDLPTLLQIENHIMPPLGKIVRIIGSAEEFDLPRKGVWIVDIIDSSSKGLYLVIKGHFNYCLEEQEILKAFIEGI